jgi:hypothetical protein
LESRKRVIKMAVKLRKSQKPNLKRNPRLSQKRSQKPNLKRNPRLSQKRSQKPNLKPRERRNLRTQRRRSKGAEGVMAGVCPKEFSGKSNNNNP